MTDLIHIFRIHRQLLEMYYKLGVIPAEYVRILSTDFQMQLFQSIREGDHGA